jgi:hypothetical protein
MLPYFYYCQSLRNVLKRTGEWSTPRQSTIVTVAPGTPFPIESPLYTERIAHVREARAKAPKVRVHVCITASI